MKIYLSAMFSRRQEMLMLAEAIEQYDHEVVSRTWLHQDDDCDIDDPAVPVLAQLDMREVAACDVMVHFAEGPNCPGAARGGRMVEYGAAAALGKRLVVVGMPENIFHRLPQVTRVSTKAQLLRLLAEWGSE